MIEIVAGGAVLAATVFLWFRLTAMSRIATGEVGSRTRRLILRRGIFAMGIWQLAISGILIVYRVQEGGHHLFPVANIMLGLGLLAWPRIESRIARTLGF